MRVREIKAALRREENEGIHEFTHASVMCWCEKAMVTMSKEDIKAGRTRACCRNACKALARQYEAAA